MPSIKDVAKEAGVGIATVSRVINNSGYVKKETRDKVEDVIKKLSYKPNEIARSMLKQKNGIVAFIVPNTTHLFFGELVHFVEQELFDYGYKLLVCNSSEQIEKELVYLDMLNQNRVDAVIFLTNNDIEKYLNKDLPLITFDRTFEGIPYVTSDNYKGGVLAANYLVVTEVSKRRIGFINQLKSRGISNVHSIEYPLGDYIRIADEVFDRLLDIPDVDGVFCISDAVAAKLVLYLEQHGKNVPEDIKVIGYDGGRSFINLGKKMTSIGQDPKLIAKALVRIINAYYDKEEIKNEVVPVYFEKGDTA
jgi:DNA-binding LacI/PurR family transcriptional regulator